MVVGRFAVSWLAKFVFGVIPAFESVVHHRGYEEMGRKVYRPAKAGEGFRRDTADGAQRKAQNARRRKKYAQMRTEEDRDGFERSPKWKKPTLLARIWEEIRHILFPPPRRF
ncbi:MAG: hypothetical protein QOJ42_5404 [Acidobacteriaceae bacterium]|nr:hypothetical protein [Acidobacteriaceae bacterium]